MEAENKS